MLRESDTVLGLSTDLVIYLNPDCQVLFPVPSNLLVQHLTLYFTDDDGTDVK